MVSTAVTTFTLSLACVLSAQAQSVSGQGTWETTLLGRDINRNAVAATDTSAVYLYDTTLNVTWLRDANVNGQVTWDAATAWAANLVTGSGGNTISDWRLPSMADASALDLPTFGGTNSGYNPTTSSSEMASLFFTTLGNKSYFNTSGVYQAGYGLTNTGSFQNMHNYFTYWLGTELTADPTAAWLFDSVNGRQGAYFKAAQFNALALRPGDVLTPVPEPETYAMLLAGLVMVGAISHRCSRAAASLAA
jgi:hypothetical protein